MAPWHVGIEGAQPCPKVVKQRAIAAPQGRAEDVLLVVTWSLRPGVGLHLGYRMLEGGADNDEVYNFSWLHYAVAGVELTL